MLVSSQAKESDAPLKSDRLLKQVRFAPALPRNLAVYSDEIWFVWKLSLMIF